MWEKVVAAVLLLLAAWQFYASYRNFHHVTQHATKNTSPFFAYANFYSWFSGALLVIMAAGLWLGSF